MADSATFLKPDDVATIAVVRALGGLGDVLVALPALAALRARFPRAKLCYIGMPQTAPLVARFPEVVDEFVAFPGFPGVIEMAFRRDSLTRFLSDQAVPAPDLAVQMHGSGGATNAFAALLEPRFHLGYHVPGAWRPGPLSLPFPDALSERDRWLALVASIGCHEVREPAFPITQSERKECDALLIDSGAEPFAVVHAGASDQRRRWPPERFAAVADRLARSGLRVVLTGTESERGIVAQVRAAMAEDALDLSGKTSLGAAAALIERAHVVVTNDTGTSHLAAALRTPSVIIFIASDPIRWAPADATRHRIVGRGVPDAVIGAAPGEADVRPAGAIPGVADVLEAVETLLSVPA